MGRGRLLQPSFLEELLVCFSKFIAVGFDEEEDVVREFVDGAASSGFRQALVGCLVQKVVREGVLDVCFLVHNGRAEVFIGADSQDVGGVLEQLE